MAFYLIIIVFIVPICVALYIWREKTPAKNVYLMISSVSFIALIMLVLGGEIINTIMGLGLFLASTSFFAGAFFSFLMPGRRIK
ncbi:hypothetical protein N9D02_10840 [Emcibacteraceae bacterium]|jgi:hypothetical protein|nr:hypothetical protein [Emcibacteraceae bacterium]